MFQIIQILKDKESSFICTCQFTEILIVHGMNISMADLGIAAHISILDYLGEVDWDSYPEAKLWYGKLKSRQSFKSLLNDKLAGIMPSESYADLDF